MYQLTLPANPKPRRIGPNHRKRSSVSRLSSEITATLPEYIPPSQTPAVVWSGAFYPDPSEEPPDYPDSANEADEETEDDVAPLSPLISPRRHRRSQSLNKSLHGGTHLALASASDTYLDSLLERSVNALEMSNNLLQSSISTHTSLSNMFEADSRVDSYLKTRTKALSSRLRENRDTHKEWMDDLDRVNEGLENLLEGKMHREQGISQSLPTYGYSMPPPKIFRKSGSRRTTSYNASTKGGRDNLFLQESSHPLNRRNIRPRKLDLNENVTMSAADTDTQSLSSRGNTRLNTSDIAEEDDDRYPSCSQSLISDRKRPRKGSTSRSSSASR